SGIAVPFETWGKPTQLELEIIGPNAVDELLASNADVRFLVDHESSLLLAQRSSFSLRLSKAPSGLRIEADLPQSDEGEAVAKLIEGGQAVGFSFNILFAGSDYREETLGIKARYIKRLQISEISLII